MLPNNNSLSCYMYDVTSSSEPSRIRQVYDIYLLTYKAICTNHNYIMRTFQVTCHSNRLHHLQCQTWKCIYTTCQHPKISFIVAISAKSIKWSLWSGLQEVSKPSIVIGNSTNVSKIQESRAYYNKYKICSTARGLEGYQD